MTGFGCIMDTCSTKDREICLPEVTRTSSLTEMVFRVLLVNCQSYEKKVQNLVNQQASSSVPCVSDVWDYCSLGHLHIEKRSELSVNAMTFTFSNRWVSCSRQGENISFFLVLK